MAINVFTSLSKYRSVKDEDYLTEALVFVVKLLLERNPSLGLDLVNFLACSSGNASFDNPETVVIKTQVSTERGRPDIEIADENILVYIEVKHDSPLTPNQLERYREQLDESDKPNTRLVLLTRSRYSRIETNLLPTDYSRIYWYQIYNWLTRVEIDDEVILYFKHNLMEFLEEKQMSMKKVKWEYTEGVSSMLNLTDMLQASLNEVYPNSKLKPTSGWDWRGYYTPDDCYCGVSYDQPLILVFTDNKGDPPITYRRDLDLEEVHFFCLSKEEQFECLIAHLTSAHEGYLEFTQKDS